MFWWIIETAITAGGIAAVALMATRSRRLSPAARHALWLLALIRLATPPLFHLPFSPLQSLETHRSNREIPEPSERRNEPVLVAGPGFEGISGNVPRSGDPEPREATTSTRTISRQLGRGLLVLYLAGTGLVVLCQSLRILRFRRQIRLREAPPEWLRAMLEDLARELRVRTPGLHLVPSLPSPVLWCLGRSVLLVPGRLVDRIDRHQWETILAHELAHLRRGDPWVSRLALVVGIAWWWNPLYWLIRHRLEVEAELACDAWVVRARSHDERLSYATTLLDVCEAMTAPRLRTPRWESRPRAHFSKGD